MLVKCRFFYSPLDNKRNWATVDRIPACPLSQALTYFLDVTTPPSQNLLYKLSQITNQEEHCQRLLTLATVIKSVFVHSSVPDCPGHLCIQSWEDAIWGRHVQNVVLQHFFVFCLGRQRIYYMEDVQVSHVPGSPRGVPNPGAIRGLSLQPAAFAEASPLFYQLLPRSESQWDPCHSCCGKLPYRR